MPVNRLTAVAASTENAQKAELWSLSLQATSIRHDMAHHREGWKIMVAPRDEEQARQQINALELENHSWPPTEENQETTAGRNRSLHHHPPTILFMGGLLIFHVITGPWASRSIWFSQGAIEGRRILLEGEWWRLLTALTLHADPVHLAGNILVGGFLIHFLSLSLGSGLAWLSLLLAGAAGNYLNIMLHGNAHTSVGFSTAVFGTIGILTGIQCMNRKKLSPRQIFMPLAAGAGLLAILGSGGERTDVGAHLWGFFSGILIGLGLAAGEQHRQMTDSPIPQSLFLVLAVVMVAGSWLVALN